MSNLIHNEQVKLQATYFNNAAVGILIGGFLPLLLRIGEEKWWVSIGFIVGGVAGSFVLHYSAAWGLRTLKE